MENELQIKWDNSRSKSAVSIDSELTIDEGHGDHLMSSSIRDQCSFSQSLANSNSTTAVINPLKNISYSDTSLSIVNIPSHPCEQSKAFSRRNTTQPLLKKSFNNAPTTSIKPLILPAPTSDSFSQYTKSNIVSLQGTHSSGSIPTPFNCQQPMAMGIATIQPQHYGYQNISNNRYPMIPMSIQNSYPTQQLTLTNGGLGTTVQLMPVMNQNNNQMNNNRMQPMPLFMAPILGSHGGMLFQPNMTIMPQSSNAMQTFNIGNTNYSNDYNQCQSILSQTINPATIRHMPIVMPNEIESYPISQSEFLSSTLNSVTTTLVTVRESAPLSSKIHSTQSIHNTSLSSRSNIKQRGLIRSQIYKMNDEETKSNVNKERYVDSPLPLESCDSRDDHNAISLLTSDEDKKGEDRNDTAENERKYEELSMLPVEPESVSICVPSATVDHSPVSCSVKSQSSVPEKILESKPSKVSTSFSNKRKLPSPEILDADQQKKVTRISKEEEKPLSGRKSPGSLFDKLSQVIPERKSEILHNNKSNKLTAVVRPEQRKMLVHYLDDLIIFESDEPFPTTNKMQVVKSALKAGNIKLNPLKSKLLNDQYIFLNAEEEISPSKHKSKINNIQSPIMKSASFLEPLTIDIPTTTSSSCDSLDSSQVRPLSVCSYQSTLPASILSRKTSQEMISPKKDTPKKQEDIVISKSVEEPPKNKDIPSKVTVEVEEKKDIIELNVTKELPPVKMVSPVKHVDQPVIKSGLDAPICSWSVGDVSDFVRQTPGCENYISLFQNHEIDGEALLLLSKDNLIQGALNMKIGPALKLCARIEKRKALDPL